MQRPACLAFARSRRHVGKPVRVAVHSGDIDAAVSSPSVIARPNPLAAPVTIATWQFSVIGVASVLRGGVFQNQPLRSRGG